MPEARTKQFLDSLQGHGKDVLDQAERIDHLEYLVPNDILKYITLIDTPGVGSVEDVHEQKTAEFFTPQRVALREMHAKQSDSLAEGADAVVYISTPVPESSAKKFFGEYMPNISAINALGVMTQIDRENNATPEIINRMVATLAQTYRRELSTVVPVSAGVYRAVKKLQGNSALEELQRMLRLIPMDKFQKRFNGSDTFLQTEGAYNKMYEEYGLTYQMRVSMVGDMPWKVFYVIAQALYYKPITEAVDYLIDYSGMSKVMDLLNKQFFRRSHSIRCTKIIKEIQQILVHIKNVFIPELRSQNISRAQYLQVVDCARGSFDANMLNSMRSFIEANIPDLSKCKTFSLEVDSLLKKADALRESMTGVEKSSEGLHLLAKMENLLRSKEEVEELEILFGKYPDKQVPQDRNYLIMRQRVWSARIQKCQNNKDFSRLLTLAYAIYGKLLNEK